ncbi:MAG TPA: hypothetical protein VF053_13600 [Streptosporangiales bacterium]
MAEPSGPRPHRFADRAGKRGAEPGTGIVHLSHVLHAATTAVALDAAGLHVTDSPVRALTVLAVSTAGSAAAGAAHERRGERHGMETGRLEGVETGRRLGRATAMLQESLRLRARQAPSPARRLPATRDEPANRDRNGR